MTTSSGRAGRLPRARYPPRPLRPVPRRGRLAAAGGASEGERRLRCFDDKAGGKANADDPAIWRNDADPGRSLVIATAKQGGLRVYDLEARQVQALAAPAGPGEEDAPGRFNNVDLLKGVRIGGAKADLAVVTDRGNDRLRVYRIDHGPARRPAHHDVTDHGVSPVFSGGPGGDQRAGHRLRPGHLDGPPHRAQLTRSPASGTAPASPCWSSPPPRPGTVT
ncbi:hypothetical protein GCM10020229_62940 [Kitasatospora albolonga]|uniref:phytase n=1 Tax=Kitasatospora albolonga TaxID=68173 RepID=UPI00337143AC